ncbi:MAG: helix-turn-helix transcriptional regulator [Deltaproteobacteria bacterium]|nr:helix-turn-helix transcriptional regulator [Deltaproteobacteria bacterium]MBW1928399.1 helix-turn-helix transcriptional regulator [Deltaproteobacteria bacterium]MBW2023802.1 helix-turn-helix transcriptional regulator [Deltaproteobacteria bacterium]MBW2124326.1 helix-turn-helix transcriptional regulator [Deltaproteobacteria bacterium]RLB19273.1 MAG: transcriptional regulator [Deltaproteobacteria bacterium]
MTRDEFATARKLLGKTQRELAQLLGTSIKAVHSYEQGWRQVPVHVERQLYFLLWTKRGTAQRNKSCWTIMHCPLERKTRCPAWEFRSGTLCWFINGTICQGAPHQSWAEKMNLCKKCDVLADLVGQLCIS